MGALPARVLPRRDGHEKFYAGGAWLQYVIDHVLRPGAVARTDRGGWFRRPTFDHELNGVVVGEQGDNRELFSLSVVHGDVERRTLRRGKPMPWDPGFVEVPELPWLGHEASREELERREATADAAAAVRSTTVAEKRVGRRRS